MRSRSVYFPREPNQVIQRGLSEASYTRPGLGAFSMLKEKIAP